MDTVDGIIEAEADIDQQLRSRDISDNRISNSTAQDAARLAGGAIDPVPGEATPLMGRVDAYSSNNWPGQADFDGLPWYRRPSIYWMLPPFLLYTLAFGGTVMPKLNLITNLFCRRYFEELAEKDPTLRLIPIDFGGGTNEQCDNPEVQKLYTAFTLMAGLIGGILSAITSPKLGSLSDRYGRKSVIVATTAGMLIGEALTIVAATHPESFNPYWLFIGYAIDGIAGTFIAGLAIAHAYATDCTPPNRRNVAFGYFHSCLFAGIGVGPLIFGLIVEAVGKLVVVFWLALAFHLLFIVALLFIIPESLSKRRQMENREKHAARRRSKASERNPRSIFGKIRLIFEPLKVLWPTGPGSSPAVRRNLVILAAIDTIMFGVAMGAVTIIVGYVKLTFHWTVLEQSYYMSAVNLTRVGCLVLLLPIVTRIVRGPQKSNKPQPQSGADNLDLNVIRFAIILDIIGFLGYSTVHIGPLFTLSGVISAIGGIGGPTLQSAMTKHVPASQTGELLGASGLLHALARVVSPLIFSAIYYATVDFMPQTVFLCLAVTFACAELLSWLLKPGVCAEETDGDEHAGVAYQPIVS